MVILIPIKRQFIYYLAVDVVLFVEDIQNLLLLRL